MLYHLTWEATRSYNHHLYQHCHGHHDYRLLFNLRCKKHLPFSHPHYPHHHKFCFSQVTHHMTHKQYNEKFMIGYNIRTEKKDNLKNHGEKTTSEEIALLNVFNDYKSKYETGPDAQTNGKEENNEEEGVSQNSQMSVLRFRSFVLKIGGFESTNYTAIERILAMDTSSEESILQAAQDYCQNIG